MLIYNKAKTLIGGVMVFKTCANLAETTSTKIFKNESITRFVQDQIYSLLNSSKLKEVVERVSLQENISKDKALRTILEKMANETEITARKKAPTLHAI